MSKAITPEELRESLRGRNLREVADDTGLGHSWLRMFARGEIPDPAYSRVVKLAAYLKRKPTTMAIQ